MIENKKGGILMQEVTLNQGIKMPQLGFGVFQVPDEKFAGKVSLWPLKLGTGSLIRLPRISTKKLLERQSRKAGFLGMSSLLRRNYGFKMLLMKRLRKPEGFP